MSTLFQKTKMSGADTKDDDSELERLAYNFLRIMRGQGVLRYSQGDEGKGDGDGDDPPLDNQDDGEKLGEGEEAQQDQQDQAQPTSKLMAMAVSYNAFRIIFGEPGLSYSQGEDDKPVKEDGEKPAEREETCANQWCPGERERHYETLPEDKRECVRAMDDIFLLTRGVDPDTGFPLTWSDETKADKEK